MDTSGQANISDDQLEQIKVTLISRLIDDVESGAVKYERRRQIAKYIQDYFPFEMADLQLFLADLIEIWPELYREDHSPKSFTTNAEDDEITDIEEIKQIDEDELEKAKSELQILMNQNG